jgi:hypothetical protein
MRGLAGALVLALLGATAAEAQEPAPAPALQEQAAEAQPADRLAALREALGRGLGPVVGEGSEETDGGEESTEGALEILLGFGLEDELGRSNVVEGPWGLPFDPFGKTDEQIAYELRWRLHGGAFLRRIGGPVRQASGPVRKGDVLWSLTLTHNRTGRLMGPLMVKPKDNILKKSKPWLDAGAEVIAAGLGRKARIVWCGVERLVCYQPGALFVGTPQPNSFIANFSLWTGRAQTAPFVRPGPIAPTPVELISTFEGWGVRGPKVRLDLAAKGETRRFARGVRKPNAQGAYVYEIYGQKIQLRPMKNDPEAAVVEVLSPLQPFDEAAQEALIAASVAEIRARITAALEAPEQAAEEAQASGAAPAPE